MKNSLLVWNARFGRAQTAALLLAVFVLALTVRFLPCQKAMSGGLRLLSTDSYGHLRRSTYVARHFPEVPFFDPYLNHPDGAVFIWPPAWDLLAGGVSRVLFGPAVSQDQVATVSAFLPPLLGALHIPFLFLLVRILLGKRRALIATAAYAVLPTAAIWSCFGHSDHHVLEVLLLLAFLSSFASAAVARQPSRRLFLAVLCGLLLTAALMTWQGAVFIAGLALPAALFLGAPLAAILGLTAVLSSSFATLLFLNGQSVPFSFVSFGWFQPLFVLFLTIPLSSAAAFVSRSKGKRILWVTLSITLLGVLLPNLTRFLGAALRGTAYLSASQLGPARDDFAGGGYLSYSADWISIIAESHPLLEKPLLQSFENAITELSAGFVFLPLAVVLWVFQGLGRRHPRLQLRLVLALFGSALFLMTLAQRRSAYYLAVFTALALTEILARLQARLKSRSLVAGMLPAAALVLLTGMTPLRSMQSYENAPGWDFLRTMLRLKKADPPGVSPYDLPRPAPGEIPGVFCPWAAGHFVTSLAWRPAAADPNAYGWRRQCLLYTSPSAEEAHRILKESRCRYLITMNLRGVLERYARAAGRPSGIPVQEMFSVTVHEARSRTPYPFLELVLDSRTGSVGADGSFQPAFRVFRIKD